MDNNILHDTIDTKMRIRGIKEYRVEGMSLRKGYIDVKIKPKCNIDGITISVKRE